MVLLNGVYNTFALCATERARVPYNSRPQPPSGGQADGGLAHGRTSRFGAATFQAFSASERGGGRGTA